MILFIILTILSLIFSGKLIENKYSKLSISGNHQQIITIFNIIFYFI